MLDVGVLNIFRLHRRKSGTRLQNTDFVWFHPSAVQLLNTSFPSFSSSSIRHDRSTSTTWRPSTTATSSAPTSSTTTGRRNWSCSSSRTLATCSSSSSFFLLRSRKVLHELYFKAPSFSSCWTPGCEVWPAAWKDSVQHARGSRQFPPDRRWSERAARGSKAPPTCFCRSFWKNLKVA